MEIGREDDKTQGEAEKIVMLHNSKEESAKSFQEKQICWQSADLELLIMFKSFGPGRSKAG